MSQEERCHTPQGSSPEGIVMQMVMGGWVARAISELCRLNIPDLVQDHGPMTAAQLNARALGVSTPALERLLRAAASVGLFTEDANARFGLTPLSRVLTSSAPGSVKAVATEIGGTWLRLFSELGETVRTGEPQTARVLGLPWWDWLNANPKELEVFGEAMKADSQASIRGLLEKCDFSRVKTVADVGSGFGHLVIALLEKYPNMHGIVMDLPELIPLAKIKSPAPAAVACRLEYVSGNMFEGVPPADAYVMKHIIVDWDDEHCVKLLHNCHRSMQGEGRLICVDSVIPPIGDTSATAAKFMDLLMMVAIRGKERTRTQWEALYAETGFRLTSIIPLQDNFDTCVIEGAKV